MTTEQYGRFIAQLMTLLIDHDLADCILWSFHNGLPLPAVNCSDMFAWGTADAEPIYSHEEISQLQQCIADVERDKGASYIACNLYAARKRRMRPQGAAYPKDKALWPLFDACGPERDTGLGNPYRPGEYTPKS